MAEATKVSQVQQFSSEWEKLLNAQVANVESFFAEVGKLESKGLAQLLGSWDEAGKYVKESVALTERVGGEFRKAALEATKRAAQLLTPKQ